MRTYEFMDKETGEEFFVEADNMVEAMDFAKTIFISPFCYGSVSEEYAEAMGYDTY